MVHLYLLFCMSTFSPTRRNKYFCTTKLAIRLRKTDFFRLKIMGIKLLNFNQRVCNIEISNISQSLQLLTICKIHRRSVNQWIYSIVLSRQLHRFCLFWVIGCYFSLSRRKSPSWTPNSAFYQNCISSVFFHFIRKYIFIRKEKLNIIGNLLIF